MHAGQIAEDGHHDTLVAAARPFARLGDQAPTPTPTPYAAGLYGTRFDDRGVVTGQTYYYQVAAQNAAG